MPSSNQVTVRPSCRRHPHRAASTATSPSPATPPRHRQQDAATGTLGPLRSATSTRTTPPPAVTVTVTVPPGAPDSLCRRLLPKLAHQQDRGPCARVPGPSTSPTNPRAARARSARPASVTLSRTAASAICAPALPGRPAPGRPPGQPATGMHARLSATRQARTRRRRGPSVAVREKPTVRPTVLVAPTPSAIRPWIPQHSGPQRDKMTHCGTSKKRPASPQTCS